MARQDTFEIGNMSQGEAKTRQEVMDAFAQSTAHAKEVLATFDDAKLMSPWTLTRAGKVIFTMPRIGFVRAIMMNHIYHHRGQLSVYLKLLDVPIPSIYGPSADENPFA